MLEPVYLMTLVNVVVVPAVGVLVKSIVGEQVRKELDTRFAPIQKTLDSLLQEARTTNGRIIRLEQAKVDHEGHDTERFRLLKEAIEHSKRT